MHEPLSLGLRYKQLNVIPSDKEGLFHWDEVSTGCVCFSYDSHSMFSIFLPNMASLCCYLCVHLLASFSATSCALLIV